ncbi:hypothetical protein KIH74_24150 [Kineosporia sp. J2-2]|uniref:Uncharacterized protein n=1 Tax=Kineosporia corallincola TaxID=2835133 RepID=A0ABS5TLU4_9ACTN|nr:hypothetical protein [Kineosporia corallincola]MBT0772057.1 hypothetical protein [Kineosporia corallincola]
MKNTGFSVRFNPPPNWPQPPAGWTPPPGWKPDPEWPPAPPDWPFWVPSGEAVHARRRGHRKLVIGLVAGGLAVVLLLVAGFAALVVLAPDPELPAGYTASDVCWADDGDADADGAPVVEVPCWDDHDYVSGEKAASQDDCPQDADGYLEESDGTVTCLEPPR